MKISGFTYVRNGFQYGYPFLESMASALPLVDELIVVVGDSHDGTREAIAAIEDPKIKIVDSLWDEARRTDGSIFALQSNIGIQNFCDDSDWALHIQADEVFREDSREKLLEAIREADARDDVDGLLFPFYHFWGDYSHIRDTRRVHPFEIRAFKRKKTIFSYRDSQGFRSYPSWDAYQQGDPGEKLKVIKIEMPVFHYSYSRNPILMKKKSNYFHRFWHDDKWLQEHEENRPFDFNDVDRLEDFTLPHPIYMKDRIAAQDWDFSYDPSRSVMSTKDKLLFFLEKITGKRWFTYKNYRLV